MARASDHPPGLPLLHAVRPYNICITLFLTLSSGGRERRGAQDTAYAYGVDTDLEHGCLGSTKQVP
jgi:hypothetical protein